MPIRTSSTPIQALYVGGMPAEKAYLGSVQVWPVADAPSGYVRVPGNPLFGTSDFYVMKYQAKDNGAGTPVSTAADTPWRHISQADARAAAQSLGAGYHLITEAEWLTIAHNIISVSSNWSSGVVGSGSLYLGHSDNTPDSMQAASSNDADGYYNTGNVSGLQRRTMTLTNGDIVWDIAGNILEWTDATIAGGGQPGPSGAGWYASREYNAGDPDWSWHSLPSEAVPSYGTPAAASWTSSQGIGILRSNYTESATRAYARGGGWGAGSHSGVLTLDLEHDGSADWEVGFRVARSI